MLRDFSPQALLMGILVAFTGFASSFAVVLEGLRAAGATAAQAESGLLALSVAMGLGGIFLSVWTRLPVSVAWSTPGAALLVASAPLEGGFAEAVGGFMLCGVALIAGGLWKPLGRAIEAIPKALASAMLAGILMALCLAPVRAVSEMPMLGLPIVLAWAVAGSFNRMFAIPAALAAFIAVVWLGVELPAQEVARVSPVLLGQIELIKPIFSIEGLLGVALPLFIVTMASQNVPGIAVLRNAGYPVEPGKWFTVTGVFSLLSTPFGGHAVNMAAITAAMCAGEDAHPNPARRYWAAVIAGIGYVAFGLMTGAVVAFVALAPPVLIQAVAGLALIPAFAGAAQAAFADVNMRDAAAVTFLTGASGIEIGGIGGAFWGLVAGGTILGLREISKR